MSTGLELDVAPNLSEPLPPAVAQRRRDSHLAPSALLATIVIAAMWLGTRPLSEQSAFLHLSIARQLLHGGGFGTPDPWVQHATYPYVTTEWLPALAAYGVESVAGLAGVAWLFCVAVLACLAVAFWMARRVADTVPALLATGAFFAAASHGLTPRPQLLGLILLGVSVSAWWQTAKDCRPRWWLVPLTWLFACSHGLWLLSVGVGLASVAGLALDRRLSWPVGGRLLGVSVLSFLAAGVTPLGPALLFTPLTVSARVHDFVGEWQATSAHDPAAIVTLAMLGLVGIGLARSRKPLPWWQVAHLGMAVVLTMAMQRTIAVGAMLAVPLVAQTLQRWRLTAVTPLGNRARWGGIVGVVVLGILAVPGVALTAHAPVPLPLALTADLDAVPAGSTVFEDANMSSWVQWTHPRLHPVFDARSEIFSRQQHVDYLRLMSVAPGWESLLRRSGATYALIRTDSALDAGLQERAGWRLVDSDSGWALLARSSSAQTTRSGSVAATQRASGYQRSCAKGQCN